MQNARGLVVGVFALAALVVSGCGGSGADPGAVGAGGPGAASRTVQHAMGSTEITGTPVTGSRRWTDAVCQSEVRFREACRVWG
jgi:hypothetical protein